MTETDVEKLARYVKAAEVLMKAKEWSRAFDMWRGIKVHMEQMGAWRESDECQTVLERMKEAYHRKHIAQADRMVKARRSISRALTPSPVSR